MGAGMIRGVLGRLVYDELNKPQERPIRKVKAPGYTPRRIIPALKRGECVVRVALASQETEEGHEFGRD